MVTAQNIDLGLQLQIENVQELWEIAEEPENVIRKKYKE